MIWLLLAASPALRPAGTQGTSAAWSVRGAAARQQLRGHSANAPLGAARVNLPDAFNTEEAPLQGNVQAWTVRGAAARESLREPNHGDASFSGGVRPTTSVYRAANTQEASVQGGGGPSLGARRVNNGALLSDGRTGNSEDNGVSGHVQAAPVQGQVAHWSVRGAAARSELRAQKHGEASFSGGVQPTKPVYRAMGSNSEDAHPQLVPVQRSVQGRVPVPGRVQASVVPVQGNVRGWAVRGAAAREQMRGGQAAAEATRDLEAPLPLAMPRASRTGNSEDAHPQAAPVQGSVRAWSVRGAAARKQLREGN